MAFSFQNFRTRLLHWEFWPLPVVYFPIYIYWLYLSIRARSFFFFSASNPGIEYGGMLGESKIKIINILPKNVVPTTVYFDASATAEDILAAMETQGISYPIILKPDVGERGWQVEMIKSDVELNEYMKVNRVAILLQEYVALPLELGVFYYRYPDEHAGRVTSIVEKGMLTVTGDGKSTVKDLLSQMKRGSLQLKRLRESRPELLLHVPVQNEQYVVEPIGNHVRGTTFLDANHRINSKIHEIFNHISLQIPGFYFGRFDLRCSSYEALETGSMYIMELNGAGAEPAHIYHPGASLWTGYKVLFSHWKAMYTIAKANHCKGVPYLSFREGMKAIKMIRKYNKENKP